MERQRPTLLINDVILTEGNSVTVNAAFTVTLIDPSGQTVTVKYATANGSATAPADYTAVPLTMLTFSVGQTAKTVNVAIKGDLLNESNETLFVNLSALVNAVIGDGQGLGSITDNDPTPLLTINDVTVSEGDSGTLNAVFTVSLLAASGRNLTVQYATANGTATAPGDYTALPLTTLSFAPGQTSKTVNVAVKGDLLDEPNETFFVNL